jgi:hypothetical protein
VGIETSHVIYLICNSIIKYAIYVLIGNLPASCSQEFSEDLSMKSKAIVDSIGAVGVYLSHTYPFQSFIHTGYMLSFWTHVLLFAIAYRKPEHIDSF